MTANEIKQAVSKLLTCTKVCLDQKGQSVNWDYVGEVYKSLKPKLYEHFDLKD